MDFRNEIPKAHYILGLVLVKQKNIAGAKESFREFIKQAPSDPIVPKVKTILSELEQPPLGLNP
jgi:TolA-binding protein